MEESKGEKRHTENFIPWPVHKSSTSFQKSSQEYSKDFGDQFRGKFSCQWTLSPYRFYFYSTQTTPEKI